MFGCRGFFKVAFAGFVLSLAAALCLVASVLCLLCDG